MQRVTRDQISYTFDQHQSPVLHVVSGETCIAETEDSREGRTRTPETTTAEFLKEMRTRGYYGNPITGPIRVEDAEPGDTLAVKIEAMQCDTLGYLGYWPDQYHMQDIVSEPVTKLVEIRDGCVHYALQTSSGTHHVRLPTQPMIGTIGTAPKMEVLLSGNTGRHGGNLDSSDIGPGATVYLPVAVPGAYLYLGDCHPRQGDGEVSGFEMRSEVTLTPSVLKNWSANQQWIRVETPTHLVTIAADRPLEAAQWLCIREMMRWLEERYALSPRESRIMITLCGDLRPGQAISGLYTMRYRMPKEHLPAS